ncbi:MAG: hypothetical protein PHU51_03925 [Candidatus Nanoarchaeia archaeon]|nr:hypothetical protein [Candidatus Nanoarchaeia archaeon]
MDSDAKQAIIFSLIITGSILTYMALHFPKNVEYHYLRGKVVARSGDQLHINVGINRYVCGISSNCSKNNNIREGDSVKVLESITYDLYYGSKATFGLLERYLTKYEFEEKEKYKNVFEGMYNDVELIPKSEKNE